jgi:lipoprotein-anchoring transpeptidase ErfK/SrfK
LVGEVNVLGTRSIYVWLGIGALSLWLGLQPSLVQAQDSQPGKVAALQEADPTPPADITSSVRTKPRAKRAARGNRAIAAMGGYSPGTIVIKTRERRLYYVLGNGQALRYPVGVGRADKQWYGHSAITGKYISPAWSPPAEIRRDNPRLPHVIPGGAPSNPMGVAAMTLAGGEYAIHGTNRPGSIGGFVSYGCIRMHNSDIMDLFARVDVGTPVVVER